MSSLRPCPLPDASLLGRYRLQEGAYTDCYSTDLDKTVSQAAFVEAFYTSWVFKLERSILKWAIAKPSTDAQAKRLAQGGLDAFSAWTVEDRCQDQLLLCDLHGRTRSWLMTVTLTGSSGSGTRLYFGSAVVPPKSPGADGDNIGAGFRLLLGFHKLYSKILLRAARNRLQAHSL